MTAASSAVPPIDHVILTRFNLPSAGPESLIRAQDGWLRERVELFERYTVPSVRRQTVVHPLHWLVFFDRESPSWLTERLAPLVAEGVFTPVYGEQFTSEEVVAEARRASGAQGALLLTTTLDNDDGLAADFAARVQAIAEPGRATALYLADGLIIAGSRVFLRHDRRNAFVSVAEPWEGAKTVWRDWHNMLHRHMPVRSVSGRPAWLQVIHGRNVSNRVRGRLVDPANYREDFPGHLDGLPKPRRAELVRDRLITIPLRESYESARRTGKQLLLATAGREGLERIKQFAERRRRGRRG